MQKTKADLFGLSMATWTKSAVERDDRERNGCDSDKSGFLRVDREASQSHYQIAAALFLEDGRFLVIKKKECEMNVCG